MATKRQLEQMVSELQDDLDEAHDRIEELESLLESIANQADSAIPDGEGSDEDDGELGEE